MFTAFGSRWLKGNLWWGFSLHILLFHHIELTISPFSYLPKHYIYSASLFFYVPLSVCKWDFLLSCLSCCSPCPPATDLLHINQVQSKSHSTNPGHAQCTPQKQWILRPVIQDFGTAGFQRSPNAIHRLGWLTPRSGLNIVDNLPLCPCIERCDLQCVERNLMILAPTKVDNEALLWQMYSIAVLHRGWALDAPMRCINFTPLSTMLRVTHHEGGISRPGL